MTEPVCIGIIIGKIYKTVNRKQLTGILEETFARNCNAFVFPLTEETNRISSSEEQLLKMIQFSMLDGMILLPYSFASSEFAKQVERFLLENCPKPVVSIGREQQHSPAVWLHDRTDMKKITRHLIQQHHCQNLLCLTGDSQSSVAQERLAGFQEALAEAELPYDEKINAVYGDFYIFAAQQLAQEFADGIRSLPDAVVCANDLMAVTLCDALKRHQISVPEQLLVTGYDGALESEMHNPPITTYSPSWEQLGRNAVCQLYQLMTGKLTPSQKQESGKLCCRCSCGCSDNHFQNIAINYPILEENYFDSNVSRKLLSCNTLESFVKTMYDLNYVFFDPDYYEKEHFCLCLSENWDTEHKKSHQAAGFSEQMLRMHYEKGYSLFPLSEMLPPDFQNPGQPNVTFFNALYFQERTFGYALLQYTGVADGVTPYYIRFCREVSNALEFLRVRNVLQSLAYHKYLSQVRDPLTGMYNLNQLPHIWKSYLSEVSSRHEHCFMIAFTIAGLYRIAENGTILQRDKILVGFAEQLQSICNYHEKCLRTGESDFLILGSEPDSSYYHQLLIQNLRDQFEQYQLSQKQVSLPLQYAILQDEEVRSLTKETVTMAVSVLMSRAKSAKQTYSEQLHYQDLKTLRNEIYQNPQQAWSISVCCQKLNISPSYFCKIYLKSFGVTCAYDIRRAKLEHSRFLLLHTSATLQEIATKCGYDYSHYMRIFKKYFGMTPTEYRRGK